MATRSENRQYKTGFEVRIMLSIAFSRGYDAARDYLLVIELIQGGVISSMGLFFLRLKGLLTSWSVAMRSIWH